MNMNPWVWRIMIMILAIAFIPVVVSGTAALVTSVIQGIGHSIHSLLRPLSMSGDARLEGAIRLCLYLVAITLICRFIVGGGKGT